MKMLKALSLKADEDKLKQENGRKVSGKRRTLWKERLSALSNILGIKCKDESQIDTVNLRGLYQPLLMSTTTYINHYNNSKKQWKTATKYEQTTKARNTSKGKMCNKLKEPHKDCLCFLRFT